ncbi:MAG: cyclodeaminase/cyclohydrolase family protein [Actinobacteria bacterium]|nr:cyclodeaminase/cyclohydrolase family protein [Actinomycetota bacterium]MCG2819792.1 cyclodeaminase/cyclohydrolase family protein [Actinomycetes bacterium]MBU4219296.1 cyclodeaminase/cyclohydrolase family protein [Actinomycetota bacterium]MBU4359580.1 cyclodeaminase/cyclohydrolase family protein [Actinomycetota bacterium]MBU4390870.1 cyclodeaminase/cyclohydrolase family protein [Actinomycetota bacterium]
MMYLEGSILGFMDKLASSSPEPGGGAASALAAAVGAALVSMVANLTVGKEKYSGVQDRVRELLTSSEEVRGSLQALVQEDTEVYGVLSVAFKMPRETDEEKEKRRQAVQAALKEATWVPYRIAEQCLQVARLSEIAADIGNVNAVSDAGVAVLLAEAGAQCAALNVKINVNSIDDEIFTSEKWAGIQDILSRTGELREKVVGVTYDKLG